LKLDLEDLESRMTPRTRLLMVSNPHNPAGRVFSREELEGIARIAQEHDLLVFADELYEDMIFEGEHISIASLSDDLFERTLTVLDSVKPGIPAFNRYRKPGKFMKGLKRRIHDMIVHTDTWPGSCRQPSRAETLAEN
jgi:hypothetical protein